VSTLLPEGYDDVGHHELAFIRRDGTIDIWCYGYQPSTNDMADRATKVARGQGGPSYTHCVQKIGNNYEVYDLSTLKKIKYGSDYTIGLPVATHHDVDAAIMMAVLA
jgi:hypothetical protein